jgi:hypothetical protein
MLFAKFVRNAGKRLSEQEKDLEIDVMNKTITSKKKPSFFGFFLLFAYNC